MSHDLIKQIEILPSINTETSDPGVIDGAWVDNRGGRSDERLTLIDDGAPQGHDHSVIDGKAAIELGLNEEALNDERATHAANVAIIHTIENK